MSTEKIEHISITADGLVHADEQNRMLAEYQTDDPVAAIIIEVENLASRTPARETPETRRDNGPW